MSPVRLTVSPCNESLLPDAGAGGAHSVPGGLWALPRSPARGRGLVPLRAHPAVIRKPREAGGLAGPQRRRVADGAARPPTARAALAFAWASPAVRGRFSRFALVRHYATTRCPSRLLRPALSESLRLALVILYSHGDTNSSCTPGVATKDVPAGADTAAGETRVGPGCRAGLCVRRPRPQLVPPCGVLRGPARRLLRAV